MVLDIRSARRLRNMRQCDLAAAVGISISDLMKLERGLVAPSKGLVHRISNCLNLSAEKLLIDQIDLYKNPLVGEGYVTAKVDGKVKISRRKKVDTAKKPVLDLFCGVGGFSFGFEMHKAFQLETFN